MAIKVDCTACGELQEKNANVIVNGIGTKECNNLKNDEGMSGKGTDCEELEDLNDCLVGNMDAELEAYDICDWKEYMHKFVPNVWTVLKGIICSICGLWTNVHKIWCWLDNITKEKNISLRAYDDKGNPINGFRIAHGVSQGTTEHSVALSMQLWGNILRATGTVAFSGNMPSSYSHAETVSWEDYLEGRKEITTQGGYSSNSGIAPNGGLLLYEYEIKKCDFEFRNAMNGWLFGNYADMQAQLLVITKGEKYPYDYGWGPNQSLQTYNPSDNDMMLIQVRLYQSHSPHIRGMSCTLAGVTGALLCTDEFDCD